jgi:hypothetical protein
VANSSSSCSSVYSNMMNPFVVLVAGPVGRLTTCDGGIAIASRSWTIVHGLITQCDNTILQAICHREYIECFFACDRCHSPSGGKR